MHQGGLFTGEFGELGESALWIIDCRWKGKVGKEKVWTYEDYETTFEVMVR